MGQGAYRQIVRLLGLLAHPARLRILGELRHGEACVCHLQALMKRPQPYVSQQLRVLREAGLIGGRREGPVVYYYHICHPQVKQLLEELLGPTSEEDTVPASCTCPCCRKDESVALSSGSFQLEAI